MNANIAPTGGVAYIFDSAEPILEMLDKCFPSQRDRHVAEWRWHHRLEASRRANAEIAEMIKRGDFR